MPSLRVSTRSFRACYAMLPLFKLATGGPAPCFLPNCCQQPPFSPIDKSVPLSVPESQVTPEESMVARREPRASDAIQQILNGLQATARWYSRTLEKSAATNLPVCQHHQRARWRCQCHGVRSFPMTGLFRTVPVLLIPVSRCDATADPSFSTVHPVRQHRRY